MQPRHRPIPRYWRPAYAICIVVATLLLGCTGTSGSQVEVRSQTEPRPATSTTAAPDCAEVLSPSAQAGQMLMVMVTTPALAKDVLDAGEAGGFGLKGRQSADVSDEIMDTIADAPAPPFVASDEEGGSVQRLEDALGELPSAQSMAKGTPEEAGRTLQKYGEKMRALGVNMIFGPVADVGNGSGLGTRSFGEDPATVGAFVSAIVKGQQDAGLITVVKHWPGIGGGKTDPHDGLDELAPIGELGPKDLVPFQAAFDAGTAAVMVAHASVPGLTADGEPASLSKAAITDELRDRENFDGLVITDSLGMGAIMSSMTQAEAAERAISAGADIALISGTDAVASAHQQLTEAIADGRIPQPRAVDAVRRILRLKGVKGDCPDLAARLATTEQEQTTTSGAPDQSDQTDQGGDKAVDRGINQEGPTRD